MKKKQFLLKTNQFTVKVYLQEKIYLKNTIYLDNSALYQCKLPFIRILTNLTTCIGKDVIPSFNK